MGSKAKVVHEEYAPQNTTDFTAPVQRIFDALKDKPGKKYISVGIIWAGALPSPRSPTSSRERYGIMLAPAATSCRC